jgi:hypothetical protein
LQRLLCVPFCFSFRGSEVVLFEPEKVYDHSLSAERQLVYSRAPGRHEYGEPSFQRPVFR